MRLSSKWYDPHTRVDVDECACVYVFMQEKERDRAGV